MVAGKVSMGHCQAMILMAFVAAGDAPATRWRIFSC
jgi:hypothetical protein